MAIELSILAPPEGATSDRKRKGRGPGSGNGKTAGRGHKGQKSRSGGKVAPGFEGGQMPMHRRLPKRGFFNRFSKVWAVVNLSDLERVFEEGEVVDAEALASRDVIWSRTRKGEDGQVEGRVTHPVKILASGELTKKLTVKAHKFSKAAEQAIVSAGGSIEVL